MQSFLYTYRFLSFRPLRFFFLLYKSYSGISKAVFFYGLSCTSIQRFYQFIIMTYSNTILYIYSNIIYTSGILYKKCYYSRGFVTLHLNYVFILTTRVFERILRLFYYKISITTYNLSMYNTKPYIFKCIPNSLNILDIPIFMGIVLLVQNIIFLN